MPPTQQANSPELAGRTILLVDDDRINRHILAGILQTEKFRVMPAASGEAALEAYAATTPDLVLLDVMLPGMDGFETCRELRRRAGEACAPVIFITALSDSEDVVKGFAAGGVDYLPKPFRPNEVLARIRFHLQHRLLIEQQRQLVDELGIANAAKNKFLGMAAHDLRNPLASIRALAEFLQDDSTGPLNAEQRELVSTIRQAADDMLGVVNKLVDPAVLEVGELKLELQPASITEVLTREVARYNLNAAHKNMRIDLQAGAAPAGLNFDPAKIQQVIGHLLRNAIRFSPLKAVITVTAEATAGGYMISVRDTGPGLPALHLQRLVEGFSGAPVSRKSSGVGLAICRRIMHAHGGTLVAENLTGGGCILRISLPTG